MDDYHTEDEASPDLRHSQPTQTSTSLFTDRSLKYRMIRGSFWTFVGYGASQVLRFGGGIATRYFLLPEVFGLMGIVNFIIYGLQMCSEIGIGTSIVQNPKGEAPEFLRTAWTVHIARGVLLWLCAVALTWPAVSFYEQTQLAWLIPAGALTILVDGLKSMKFFTLTRRLEIGRLTFIDLSCQALTIGVMIGWAWLWPSVWALVAGALAGTALRVILSHWILGPPRMRLEFHPEIAGALIRFGVWLFISTVFTFLIGYVDKVALGKLMNSMARFGVYMTAFMFSNAMVDVVRKVSQNVLLPVYARLAEDGGARLRYQTIRIRRLMLLATLPPVWVLVVWGPEIVGLLLPSEYAGAGVFLQLLAVGTLFSTIFIPVGSVLLAVGDSFRHMILQAVQSSVMMAAMLIGALWGRATEVGMVNGVILGYVSGSFLYYPVLAVLVRRYRVWFPLLDLAALAASALAVGLGFWAKSL